MRPVQAPRVAAVIVAAGSGLRLGADVPKAFVRVGGQTLLHRCTGTFAAHPQIDAVVLVVPPDQVAAVAGECPGMTVVSGGSTRQRSVANGLAALPDAVELVLVHDAARTLLGAQVISRVVAALDEGERAVIPVLPVTDTIKQVSADHVVATIERADLRAVQTPQGFRVETLRAAHAAAGADAGVTDDAGLVERAGVPVRVVAGDPHAFKITVALDLLLAEAILTRAQEPA